MPQFISESKRMRKRCRNFTNNEPSPPPDLVRLVIPLMAKRARPEAYMNSLPPDEGTSNIVVMPAKFPEVNKETLEE